MTYPRTNMGLLSRLLGRNAKAGAARLVQDATVWARERFPPPLEKFPTVPQADAETWRSHAAAAAIEIGVLFVEATTDKRRAQAIVAEVDRELRGKSATTAQAFVRCKRTMDSFIDSQLAKGAEHSDLGFALGMWMWNGVYGRAPSPAEGGDMYDLGRLVHASFGDY